MVNFSPDYGFISLQVHIFAYFLLLLAQKWFFSWWVKLHLGSNFHLLDACMILRDIEDQIGQIWCGYLTSGFYSIPTNLPSKINLYFFFLHGGLFRSPWYLPSIWEICMRGRWRNVCLGESYMDKHNFQGREVTPRVENLNYHRFFSNLGPPEVLPRTF